MVDLVKFLWKRIHAKINWLCFVSWDNPLLLIPSRSGIIFVGKDGGILPFIDYHGLNHITILNRYGLLLIYSAFKTHVVWPCPCYIFLSIFYQISGTRLVSFLSAGVPCRRFSHLLCGLAAFLVAVLEKIYGLSLPVLPAILCISTLTINTSCRGKLSNGRKTMSDEDSGNIQIVFPLVLPPLAQNSWLFSHVFVFIQLHN